MEITAGRMPENILRGRVAAKYGNCTRFAKALNWSGRKTRDIVSGRQVANADDISQMAKALEISDPVDFMYVFFSS